MHQRPARGFTMIELVIVMAMLGLLLSLALPQYMATLERGREQVLQSNLATMREAIDKYYGDRGRYPERLEDLVRDRYLRAIPNDPYTEAPTWVVIAPKDAALGGVIDVQRASPGMPDGPAGLGPADPPLPDFVQQEGGAARIVGVVAVPDAAASAPAAGSTR